jgi:hypothetical protein
MTQPGQFRIWPRLGFRGWTILIAWFALVVAILITFTLIAFGLFLFFLPVFAILMLLYYLFPSRFRTARYRRTEDATIIDGEFRVVDSPQVERKRPEERN